MRLAQSTSLSLSTGEGQGASGVRAGVINRWVRNQSRPTTSGSALGAQVTTALWTAESGLTMGPRSRHALPRRMRALRLSPTKTPAASAVATARPKHQVIDTLASHKLCQSLDRNCGSGFHRARGAVR